MNRQGLESLSSGGVTDKEEDYCFIDWEPVNDYLDDLEKRVNQVIYSLKEDNDGERALEILEELSDDLW